MSRILRAMVFSLLAASSTPVFGAYTLTISSIAKNVRFDYPVAGSVEVTESITVKHKGDALSFFLTFSSGQSGSSWDRSLISTLSETLTYTIVDSIAAQNVLLDLPDNPTAANVLSGNMATSASWQTAMLTYTVIAQSDQYVPKDTYDDTITVTLYAGTLSSAVEEDSASVSLKATVPELIELSVLPTGDPFDPLKTSLTFDFGVLTEGELLAGDLIVRSNAAYTLSLQSANKGVMANTDPTDSSEIPYEFLFDGVAATLTSNQPTDVAVGQAPTGTAGVRYGFSVQILAYGMATEGSYEDVVTITVSSK